MVLHLIACFFGGAFAINIIPHFVAGVSGRPFQSPFAKPPGKGLSSSLVNTLWSWVNIVIAYLLLFGMGSFDAHATPDLVAFAAGAFVMSVQLAWHFGSSNGGNLKRKD